MLKLAEIFGIADVMANKPLKGLFISLLLSIAFLGTMYLTEHRRADRKEAEVAALNAKLIQFAERAARAIDAVNEKRIDEIKTLSGVDGFAKKQAERLKAIEEKIQKIK